MVNTREINELVQQRASYKGTILGITKCVKEFSVKNGDCYLLKVKCDKVNNVLPEI